MGRGSVNGDSSRSTHKAAAEALGNQRPISVRGGGGKTGESYELKNMDNSQSDLAESLLNPQKLNTGLDSKHPSVNTTKFIFAKKNPQEDQRPSEPSVSEKVKRTFEADIHHPAPDEGIGLERSPSESDAEEAPTSPNGLERAADPENTCVKSLYSESSNGRGIPHRQEYYSEDAITSDGSGYGSDTEMDKEPRDSYSSNLSLPYDGDQEGVHTESRVDPDATSVKSSTSVEAPHSNGESHVDDYFNEHFFREMFGQPKFGTIDVDRLIKEDGTKIDLIKDDIVAGSSFILKGKYIGAKNAEGKDKEREEKLTGKSVRIVFTDVKEKKTLGDGAEEADPLTSLSRREVRFQLEIFDERNPLIAKQVSDLRSVLVLGNTESDRFSLGLLRELEADLRRFAPPTTNEQDPSAELRKLFIDRPFSRQPPAIQQLWQFSMFLEAQALRYEDTTSIHRHESHPIEILYRRLKGKDQSNIVQKIKNSDFSGSVARDICRELGFIFPEGKGFPDRKEISNRSNPSSSLMKNFISNAQEHTKPWLRRSVSVPTLSLSRAASEEEGSFPSHGMQTGGVELDQSNSGSENSQYDDTLSYSEAQGIQRGTFSPPPGSQVQGVALSNSQSGKLQNSTDADETEYIGNLQTPESKIMSPLGSTDFARENKGTGELSQPKSVPLAADTKAITSKTPEDVSAELIPKVENLAASQSLTADEVNSFPKDIVDKDRNEGLAEAAKVLAGTPTNFNELSSLPSRVEAVGKKLKGWNSNPEISLNDTMEAVGKKLKGWNSNPEISLNDNMQAASKKLMYALSDLIQKTGTDLKNRPPQENSTGNTAPVTTVSAEKPPGAPPSNISQVEPPSDNQSESSASAVTINRMKDGLYLQFHHAADLLVKMEKTAGASVQDQPSIELEKDWKQLAALLMEVSKERTVIPRFSEDLAKEVQGIASRKNKLKSDEVALFFLSLKQAIEKTALEIYAMKPDDVKTAVAALSREQPDRGLKRFGSSVEENDGDPTRE